MNTKIFFVLTGILLFNAAPSFAKKPKGPFYGFGAQTTGGAKGERILVTTLEGRDEHLIPEAQRAQFQCPDPDGRAGGTTHCPIKKAVSQPNRTIEFAVAGTITLTGHLIIDQPNITLDGSTAPRGGIQFRTDPTITYTSQTRIRASNVIVKHLRFRHGDYNLIGASLWVANGSNIVLDHISCQWSNDECLGIQGYEDDETSNVTVQNSLFSESFMYGEQKMSLGKSILISGNAYDITLYNNVFSLNGHRSPQITPGYLNTAEGMQNGNHLFYSGKGRYDVYRNIMYGVLEPSIIASASKDFSIAVDFTENLYLRGQISASAQAVTDAINRNGNIAKGKISPTVLTGVFPALNPAWSPDIHPFWKHEYGPVALFVDGNIDERYRPNSTYDECNLVADGLNGGSIPCKIDTLVMDRNKPILTEKSATAHKLPQVPKTQLIQQILLEAGATKPCRDSVDRRAITAVQTRKGKYVEKSPSEVGGYPNLAAGCL